VRRKSELLKHPVAIALIAAATYTLVWLASLGGLKHFLKGTLGNAAFWTPQFYWGLAVISAAALIVGWLFRSKRVRLTWWLAIAFTATIYFEIVYVAYTVAIPIISQTPTADAQAQMWTVMSSFLTVVGFFPVLLSLSGIAVYGWAENQRRPDLNIVFSDTLTESAKISSHRQVEMIHPFHFAVINEGDRMTRWFEVTLDFSRVLDAVLYPPEGLTGGWYRLPERDTPGLHVVFRNAGRTAAFKGSPLDLGELNIPLIPEKLGGGKLEIPYRVDCEWGVAKEGKLWLDMDDSAAAKIRWEVAFLTLLKRWSSRS